MNHRALSFIIGSLLLPLGCGGTETPSCSDQPDDVVATFEDATLEAAIRAVLSVSAQGDLTCGLVSGLTNLETPPLGIRSLVGIENLMSLTALELEGNSISDVGPLTGLTSLKRLHLTFNAIRDLGPLSGLTGLTDLDVGSNLISDIGALSGLTGLMGLVLASNSISDIGALSGLTSLTSLDLASNSISDVSALSGLTSLTNLFLEDNPNLTDIQPLLGNAGLGVGDRVALRSTSVSCADVALLEGNGVLVFSDCR